MSDLIRGYQEGKVIKLPPVRMSPFTVHAGRYFSLFLCLDTQGWTTAYILDKRAIQVSREM